MERILESLDERRESERLGLDGEMLLRYGDVSVEGELLDISSGGALGRFSIKTGIPPHTPKSRSRFHAWNENDKRY
ncbi:MAG: PilZ domain-containing protein [Nitrospirae bacterium]|nr:PilZ domain-containing protein [Nitrospirota bacterium]